MRSDCIPLDEFSTTTSRPDIMMKSTTIESTRHLLVPSHIKSETTETTVTQAAQCQQAVSSRCPQA
eukprot:8321731-Alexandrium_andersonii.AAC.1